MPDIEVLSSDPGREVRVGQGARILVIRDIQRSPSLSAGLGVMGVIGSPTNDRGVPNVPVLLASVQDIFSKWGGFKAHVGDGYATGYNGNVAAMLWRLLCKRVVFQPMDMALYDKVYSDDTKALTKSRVARGAQTFTVEADDELFTAAGHGLAANDTIQLVSLTGGTGLSVDTTYHVIATGLTANAFSVSTTQGGSAVNVTADGSGTFRPIAKATPGLAAYVLPAGTRIATSNSSFIVRTLEDVVWDIDEFAAQEVRVAKVSGTEADLNTVEAFVDTPTDTTVVVHTATSATPFADSNEAADILARYEAAIDAFNVNEDGKSATVLVIDRTEAAINDALATHCSEASGQGILRICVTAPPVGTTVTNAKAASGDGVDRATLETEYTAFVHPGFRRRFDPDQANLDVDDDYKATFPGQALLAARMVNTRPEENPTYVDSEPFTTYGVAEVELELSAAEKAAHYQAGICTAVTERFRGRWVGAYRDGVMADGTQIARKRLSDYLTAGAIERATPWHKRLATTDNRQGLFDSVESWLESLKNPSGAEQQRISDYTLTLTWDGEVEEATLLMEVEEVGNMNVLTIRLSVGASGFSVLGGEEA